MYQRGGKIPLTFPLDPRTQIPMSQPEILSEQLSRKDFKNKYLHLINITNFKHNLVDQSGDYLLWESESPEYYQLTNDFNIESITKPEGKEYVSSRFNFQEIYSFFNENIIKSIKISNEISVPMYYGKMYLISDIFDIINAITGGNTYLSKIIRLSERKLFNKNCGSKFITISAMFNVLNVSIFLNKYFEMIKLIYENNTETSENIVNIQKYLKKNKQAFDLIKSKTIKIGDEATLFDKYNSYNKQFPLLVNNLVEKIITQVFPIDGDNNIKNLYDIYKYYKSITTVNSKDKNTVLDGTMRSEIRVPSSEEALYKHITEYETDNFTKDILDSNNKYKNEIKTEIIGLIDLLSDLSMFQLDDTIGLDHIFLLNFYFFRLYKSEILGGFPININQQLKKLEEVSIPNPDLANDTEETRKNIDDIRNKLNPSMPILYEYSLTNYKGKNYGNCMENTILQFLKLLFWDTETYTYKFDKYNQYDNPNLLKIKEIFVDITKERTQNIIDKWTEIITNIKNDKIKYYRSSTDSDVFDIEVRSSVDNFLNIIGLIFGFDSTYFDKTRNQKMVEINRKLDIDLSFGFDDEDTPDSANNEYGNINFTRISPGVLSLDSSEQAPDIENKYTMSLDSGHAYFKNVIDLAEFAAIKKIEPYLSQNQIIKSLVDKDDAKLTKYIKNRYYLCFNNRYVLFDILLLDLDSKMIMKFLEITDKIYDELYTKAIRRGESVTKTDLIRQNELIDHIDLFTGFPALFIAINNKKNDVVKMLINMGADINIQNINNDTAILCAISNDNMEIFKLLNDLGADINKENIYGNTPLITAVYKNEEEIINTLISRGADINKVMASNYTLLMVAAEYSNSTINKLFIDKGIPVNTKGTDGKTALILASSAGKTEVVKMLIEANASINDQDNDLKTSLIYAILNRHIDTCKLLIESGADVDEVGSYGFSALLYACQYGLTEIVEILINMDVDIHLKNYDDQSALVLAALNNSVDICKLLIDNGIDINYTNNNNKTALMEAVSRGRFEAAELLINTPNINLNIQLELYKYITNEYVKDKNALMLACDKRFDTDEKNNNNIKIVKLLIDKGADVNIQTEDTGDTALMFAIEKGNFEIAEILINSPNINLNLYNSIVDPQGNRSKHMSPLMFVCKNIYKKSPDNIDNIDNLDDLLDDLESNYVDNPEEKIRMNNKLAELLIAKGADINFESEADKFTPLIRAINSKNTDIALMLINAGANFNTRTQYGITPLMSAIRNNNYIIAKTLIDKGAELDVVDDNNNTAANIASQQDDIKFIELLINTTADFNIPNEIGISPLIMFLRNRYQIGKLTSDDFEIIDKMIRLKNVDVNQMTAYDEGILNNAIMFGNQELIKILIKAGADLDVPNQDGETPRTLIKNKPELLAFLTTNSIQVGGKDKYYSKYLKYKTKYMELKNNLTF